MGTLSGQSALVTGGGALAFGYMSDRAILGMVGLTTLLFLARTLCYADIARVVEEVMAASLLGGRPLGTLGEALAADSEGRVLAGRLVAKWQPPSAG